MLGTINQTYLEQQWNVCLNWPSTTSISNAMEVDGVRNTGWQWVRPLRWFWQTFGWNRGSHNWNYRHLNVKPTHNLALLASMTALSRVVECEVCNRWFHAKCQQISNTEYDSMQNQFWMCSFCCENDQTDINHSSETKIFLRYVVDIVGAVRGDTKELFDAVNNLNPNLQFTLETTDDKNSLPFLDMSTNVQPEGNIFLLIASKAIRYWNNSDLS